MFHLFVHLKQEIHFCFDFVNKFVTIIDFLTQFKCKKAIICTKIDKTISNEEKKYGDSPLRYINKINIELL